MPTPRRLIATATAALLALASPAFPDMIGSGQNTVNGTGRGSEGENIGRGSSAWDEWCGGCGRPMPRSVGLPNSTESGAPFYGYNPNLLAQGDQAVGRARAATYRPGTPRAVGGFIIGGNFYATNGTLVVRGVQAKPRPGALTPEAVRSPSRRTPDARPRPNPDRPSLGNKPGKSKGGKASKSGGNGRRGKAA